MQHYNALQIGQVQMWMGLPQLFLLPLLPLVLKLFDGRLVIGFGLALFGISCGMNAYMSPDTAIDQLKTAQLVRAAGQPFIISPLSQMATVGIAPAQAGGASALFNMARNAAVVLHRIWMMYRISVSAWRRKRQHRSAVKMERSVRVELRMQSRAGIKA